MTLTADACPLAGNLPKPPGACANTPCVPETREPMSPRQWDCYAFVLAFHEQYGFSPSVREIGLALGGISTNAVSDLLNRLLVRGYLTNGNRIKGAGRSLMIVHPRARFG